MECDAEAQASNPAFIVVTIALGIAIIAAAIGIPIGITVYMKIKKSPESLLSVLQTGADPTTKKKQFSQESKLRELFGNYDES